MAKTLPNKVYTLKVTQEELHIIMDLVTDWYASELHRILSRSIAMQVGMQGGSSYKGGYIGMITSPSKRIDQ